MSISLVLVPMAMAAATAITRRAAEPAPNGQIVQRVQTRMRDEGLLAAALQDTFAVVEREPGRMTARWLGVDAVFSLDPDGIWHADFRGEVDADRASSIVVAVDQAYGRQVQQAVLARVRERAPVAGMQIASQTVEDDDSVTLVLNVVGR